MIVSMISVPRRCPGSASTSLSESLDPGPTDEETLTRCSGSAGLLRLRILETHAAVTRTQVDTITGDIVSPLRGLLYGTSGGNMLDRQLELESTASGRRDSGW